MKYIFIVTLLSFLITGCGKSRLCVGKNKLQLNELDENNVPHHIYSHNASTIQIPQYFTPNGDGINDLFIAKVDSENSGISSYELRISSGCALLFSTDKINAGWDGSFKGERYKKGKYKFKLDITWEDGLSETFKEKFEFVID